MIAIVRNCPGGVFPKPWAKVEQPFDIRTAEFALFSIKRMLIDWGYNKSAVRVDTDTNILKIMNKEVAKSEVNDFVLKLTWCDGEWAEWEELQNMSEDKFNMLDLLLAPADHVNCVLSIGSDRFATLASHHFPVSACLQVGIMTAKSVGRHVKRNLGALKNPEIRQEFTTNVQAELMNKCNPDLSLDDRWEDIRDVLSQAADKFLPPPTSVEKKRPWISEATLELLKQRSAARLHGDYDIERLLTKDIKRSARRDRSNWLKDLAGSGDWQSLRLLTTNKTSKYCWRFGEH